MNSPTLSIIIVNYRSAELTLRAVESVQIDQSVIEKEVIVVDNSNDASESEYLRKQLPAGVRLLVSEQNQGFGRACNFAYKHSGGEYILLLNPDAYVLPGALMTLACFLQNDTRCGAVAPLTYWDEGHNFVLPPMPMPSPWDCAKNSLIYASRPLARYYQMAWRRKLRNLINQSQPLRQKNLSGGIVMLRRTAIESAGGLFDPRFFMYFEDADLFRRLKNAGFDLYLDPRAKAVHNYNQTGDSDMQKKSGYFLESHQKFVQMYDRRYFATNACRILQRIMPNASLTSIEYLGTLRSPVSLTVPDKLSNGWMLEWSPVISMIPAAASAGTGQSVTFPAEAWKLLRPGRHYARLGGIHDFFTYKTWSWDIV